MNNQKLGAKTERKVCEMLSKEGFWVHFMRSGKNGQPADLLAVCNETAFLIDVKYCKAPRFVLSRIEENQHSAMQMWEECGNGVGWFAIVFDDAIFFMDYTTMMEYQNAGAKSIPRDCVESDGYGFKLWCLYRQ